MVVLHSSGSPGWRAPTGRRNLTGCCWVWHTQQFLGVFVGDSVGRMDAERGMVPSSVYVYLSHLKTV